MTRLGARIGTLPPQTVLGIYVIVMLFTAVGAIGSVLFATSRVDEKTELATQQADAAVAASEISVALRAPIIVMFTTGYAFLQSDALDGLSPEVKSSLIESSLRQSEDLDHPLASFPLPAVTVDITEQNAFELLTSLQTVSTRIEVLLASAGSSVDLTAVASERDKLDAALAAFVDSKSLTSFRDTFTSLITLGALLSEASQGYSAALDGTQASLTSATRVARYTMVGALLLLSVIMMLATLFVGRLIQRAFLASESEREVLRATTETLRYRNDQLNALYNVFAEITDTLSMRYVIRATLRETLRVMRASFVTMRLLKGSQLVSAGTLSDEGEEPNLDPVPLGEGPSGRVARRGRSMRIDSDAQDLLGQSVNPAKRMESGIIVPLVVGARIVGTLSCWSSRPHAFQDQDERVLEMMASQVATAVIAADTQETLERRALLDPLTNLPNRRHLSEDMTEFANWRKEGRAAVVAMMDLDHFKQVNDDFGHKVGDVTLQKIAAVMRQALREKDRIYRYGGEEFVIVLPDTGEEEAVKLAERMLKAVAETPLTGDQLEPVGPVTLSAGLAVMPDHGSDVAELIVLADRAMYRAKQGGRNRIEVWDEGGRSTVSPAA
jgi:diguanylate cyclase (GGDEF)-like protein